MTFTMNNTDDRKWEILSTEYLLRRPWFTEEEVKALLERDRLITDMFVNNSLCFKESAEYTAVGSSNLYSDFNKLRELLITTYTESGGCIEAFLEYPSKELPAIKGINGKTYTFNKEED
mgnify:CR=1 FL=1